MKLLFDTHHSTRAAERLRKEGYDVTAAGEDQLLAILSDEELLAAAARAGRALVTENVKDFDRVVRAWAAGGEHHAGVLFTSPAAITGEAPAIPRISSPLSVRSWMTLRMPKVTGCSGFPESTTSRDSIGRRQRGRLRAARTSKPRLA